jgi:hypothetical protein
MAAALQRAHDELICPYIRLLRQSFHWRIAAHRVVNVYVFVCPADII